MIKMIIRLSILYLLALVCQTTIAQTTLNIETQNRCQFSDTTWESDLYRFDVSAQAQAIVKEICQLADVPQNFELVQTNVENVVAVYDTKTNKRYILYSQDFIERAESSAIVYIAFAHEIGHHAFGHILDNKGRANEESYADMFMGFVMAKLNDSTITSTSDVYRLLEKHPSPYPRTSPLHRIMDIEAGWSQAQRGLTGNKNMGFSDDDMKAFLNAKFPFPPPPCCSPREIPLTAFSKAKNLGDVAKKLTTALEDKGYTSRSFLSVPNGFAIVTQMEQYNEDCTSRTDNRWADVPMNAAFVDFLDYFKKLIFPTKTYYRTFVFIVTTNAFNLQGKTITKNEAMAWSNSGINALPDEIINLPYTEKVKVTALVYEFVVPDSNRKPTQKCPNVDTQLHMEKSGIWKGL
jgi:hypothetical protein